jgi:hypothetical protein
MNNDTFAHRRAFYLLKKYNSYTWNEESFRLTKEFAEAFEKTLRHPPPEFAPVNDMDEMFLVECWNACGELEEGLALILQGDKGFGYEKYADGVTRAGNLLAGDPDRGSPRRYIEAPGQDDRYVKLGYLRSLGYDLQYQQPQANTGIFALLDKVNLMLSYGSFWFHIESIANSVWPEPLSSSLLETQVQIPRWHPAQLPSVPQPIPEAPVIVSGDEVPITGIWQPEILTPLDQKTLALIGGMPTYCMNFLVQGNTAPEMVPESAYELWEKTGNGPKSGDEYPVRWRLLWADDRYGKNGIPDEEKDYLRVEEDVVPLTSSPPDTGIKRCEANHPCPRAGYWSTPAKQGSRRYFTQGEIMQDFPASRYGATIWYWDLDQDTK